MIRHDHHVTASICKGVSRYSSCCHPRAYVCTTSVRPSSRQERLAWFSLPPVDRSDILWHPIHFVIFRTSRSTTTSCVGEQRVCSAVLPVGCVYTVYNEGCRVTCIFYSTIFLLGTAPPTTSWSYLPKVFIKVHCPDPSRRVRRSVVDVQILCYSCALFNKQSAEDQIL